VNTIGVTEEEAIKEALAELSAEGERGDQETKGRVADALGAWARKRLGEDLADFADKFVIETVTSRPIYNFALTTQYECRGLVRCREGTTTASVPPTDIDESEDIWGFEEARTEFGVDETRSHRYEGSRRVESCGPCSGAGQTTCMGCDGSRQIRCSRCAGSGQENCSSCGGAGKKKCHTCGGSSWQTCGAGQHAVGTNGGKTKCSRCGGSPKTFTGKYKCTKCPDGFHPCTMCNSTGKKRCTGCGATGQVTCGRCSGAGVVTCSTCDGRKQLMLWLETRVHFNHVTAEERFVNATLPAELVEALAEASPRPELDIYGPEVPAGVLVAANYPAFGDLCQGVVTGAAGGAPSMAARVDLVRESAKTLEQHAVIGKYDVLHVSYTSGSRTYDAYIHGDSDSVWAPVSPVDELVDDLLEEGKNYLAKGDIQHAQDLFEQVLKADDAAVPENPSFPTKTLLISWGSCGIYAIGLYIRFRVRLQKRYETLRPDAAKMLWLRAALFNYVPGFIRPIALKIMSSVEWTEP
jgi:hypothetical protein